LKENTLKKSLGVHKKQGDDTAWPEKDWNPGRGTIALKKAKELRGGRGT